MGNLCGKPSIDDTPAGRPLGSSTPAYGTTTTSANGAVRQTTTRPSAPRPAQRVGGPARTVGAGLEHDAASGIGDPRAAAARAAEARASKAQPRGRLGEQLAAQKKQTRAETLDQASRTERDVRMADSNAETRNYN